MFDSWSLKRKLVVYGTVLTAIPLLLVGVVMFAAGMVQVRHAAASARTLMLNNQDTILKDVVTMCELQRLTLEDHIRTAMTTSISVLDSAGRAETGSDTLEWQVKNQLTGESKTVQIPKMVVGGNWLGKVRDFEQEAAVVDRVKRLTNATSTIFQRINEQGDMLRVCTNVPDKEGKRAIGTYIPAVNPDGKPNPVVSTILQGQTYTGRAFVVDGWYITNYKPLISDQRVIGMLYVGIKQTSQDALNTRIRDMQVGKSGYVFVLNAAGQDRGRYVISKNGERDGEVIEASQDANGEYFVRKMCDQALSLGDNNIGEIRYPWRNTGEDVPRIKNTRFTYFKSWDWLVGCGVYEDDFNDVVKQVTSSARTAQGLLIVITLGAVLATILVWFYVSRSLAGKISVIAADLDEGAKQTASAASQVSSASQNLSKDASKQVTATTETSRDLENMTGLTKANATHSEEARVLSMAVNVSAQQGLDSMQKMIGAIQEIKEASDETAKIVRTIDDIAFQTNMLALNAAVEAARAGDSGKGFAVVAGEVRTLAQRSAEAAKTTAALIQNASSKTELGVEISAAVGKNLAEIREGVMKVHKIVETIAEASTQQARGIDQINASIAQVDVTAHGNASTAEEAAATAEELNSQVDMLREIVVNLTRLVGQTAQAAVTSSRLGQGGMHFLAD